MKKRVWDSRKISISAMFLAIGWLLPFLSGQIPQVGNMLCLIHIPAILAGFLLGPWYGMAIGFLIPITRSMIFGMPPLYPKALCMAFELAAYGFLTGELYGLLKKLEGIKETGVIYISLVLGMLGGRMVWGIAMFCCGMVSATPLTWKLFLTEAFVNAWPGILIQVCLLPALIKLMRHGWTE